MRDTYESFVLGTTASRNPTPPLALHPFLRRTCSSATCSSVILRAAPHAFCMLCFVLRLPTIQPSSRHDSSYERMCPCQDSAHSSAVTIHRTNLSTKTPVYCKAETPMCKPLSLTPRQGVSTTNCSPPETHVLRGCGRTGTVRVRWEEGSGGCVWPTRPYRSASSGKSASTVVAVHTAAAMARPPAASAGVSSSPSSSHANREDQSGCEV
jgi:hypothetical protein